MVDVKRIAELRPAIREDGGRLVISAGTVMTDVAADDRVRRHFPALAEAAAVVGSVQIRNRATLAGNICNASPAADTAPPLLVYGADVVAAGPGGTRRIPIDDFFVRSGRDDPGAGRARHRDRAAACPGRRMGAVHVRRTRRRGHDLASVTLCCGVDEAGVTRLAYGSVGPRPVLVVDESGVLADPAAPDEAKAAILERMFADASPSPRSMRASPEYRLAMLRVLGGGRCGPRSSGWRRGSDRDDRDDPHRADRQRAPARARGGRPPHPARRPARRPRPDRHQGVLPGGRVRRLHRHASTAAIVDSCLVLAVEADGGEVTTVEGLAAGGRLSPLQQAFLDKGAAQCGFCIPGQLMAAHALLRADPHPTVAEIQEGLAGNLCRCAGYEQITEAVLAAAEAADR